MSCAWYNEIDPYAVQWLKNLIAKNLIALGEVDERPIQDVKPADLKSFIRCHFFAGIAGWDIALRLANFPPDRQVWTGSCPCQPFSTAGARRGFADERHLWPYWFHLIQVCRPPVILGEQVANGAGPWLDLVLADLEGADYAVGAAVLPAAGVGAPHIRDRVWFVAESDCQGQHGLSVDAEVAAVPQPFVADTEGDGRRQVGCNDSGYYPTNENEARNRLGDASEVVSDSVSPALRQQPEWSNGTNGFGAPVARELGEDVAYATSAECFEQRPQQSRAQGGFADGSAAVSDPHPPRRSLGREPQLLEQRATSQRSGWWSVEPGLGRVVDGFPTRAQRLRAYGNAIVPACATEFIKAYMQCRP